MIKKRISIYIFLFFSISFNYAYATILCSKLFSSDTKNADSIRASSLIKSLIQQNGFTTYELPESKLSKFKAVDLETLGKPDFYTARGIANQSWFSFKRYIDAIRMAYQKFNARSQLLDKVDVAVYPGSGTDSPYIVNLFPYAKIYVAINVQIFAQKSQDGFAFRKPVETSSFREYRHIRESSSQGSDVLSSLAASVPNFRLKKVTLFGPEPTTKANAWIEFDRGPGTSPQFFLYINQHLRSANSISKYWWSSLLTGSIGVALKGAMDLQYNKEFQNLLNVAASSNGGVAIGPRSELNISRTEYSEKTAVEGLAFGYDIGIPKTAALQMFRLRPASSESD